MLHPILRKSIFSFAILLSLISNSSCSITLAPEYDKAIVEKTSDITTETLMLFAEVSSGTKKDSFVKRENTYNELIGSFDALSLQAKARPLPNVSLDRLNQLMKQKGMENVSGDYPSATAFKEIALTLSKMKATDESSGLNPTVVAAFKGQIEIYLEQAITYETFLKR